MQTPPELTKKEADIKDNPTYKEYTLNENYTEPKKENNEIIIEKKKNRVFFLPAGAGKKKTPLTPPEFFVFCPRVGKRTGRTGGQTKNAPVPFGFDIF